MDGMPNEILEGGPGVAAPTDSARAGSNPDHAETIVGEKIGLQVNMQGGAYIEGKVSASILVGRDYIVQNTVGNTKFRETTLAFGAEAVRTLRMIRLTGSWGSRCIIVSQWTAT